MRYDFCFVNQCIEIYRVYIMHSLRLSQLLRREVSCVLGKILEIIIQVGPVIIDLFFSRPQQSSHSHA